MVEAVHDDGGGAHWLPVILESVGLPPEDGSDQLFRVRCTEPRALLDVPAAKLRPAWRVGGTASAPQYSMVRHRAGASGAALLVLRAGAGEPELHRQVELSADAADAAGGGPSPLEAAVAEAAPEAATVLLRQVDSVWS